MDDDLVIMFFGIMIGILVALSTVGIFRGFSFNGYEQAHRELLKGKAAYQYVTTADGNEQLLKTNEYNIQCTVKE